MFPQLTISVHQFFQAVPLFQSLTQEELGELVRVARARPLQPGEVLFSQLDPADGMYVIERGEVSVMTTGAGGENVTLAYLGNGAVVGEMSLLDGSARSATVEAVSSTSGFWFPRDAFEALRAQGHVGVYKVLRQLARTLEQRRRTTTQRIRGVLEDAARAEAAATPEARQALAQVRWI